MLLPNYRKKEREIKKKQQHNIEVEFGDSYINRFCRSFGYQARELATCVCVMSIVTFTPTFLFLFLFPSSLP